MIGLYDVFVITILILANEFIHLIFFCFKVENPPRRTEKEKLAGSWHEGLTQRNKKENYYKMLLRMQEAKVILHDLPLT